MSGSTTAIVTENIRQLRRAHGFTQQTFAEAVTRAGCNIGRVGIAKVEAGLRAAISVEELVVFGKVLGVDPGALLKPLKFTIHTEVKVILTETQVAQP